MIKLQELYNISYDILREDQSDVSSYPKSLIKSYLNLAQMDFCSGTIINPMPISSDLKLAKKGRLPFLYTEELYPYMNSPDDVVNIN